MKKQKIEKHIILKPLSVNKAFQGRRFKTKEYLQYENDALILLRGKEKISGFVEVEYRFYIKNYYKSDVGNFEKLLTDIIVKAELIDDDRFIKKITLEKFPAQLKNIEVIEVVIKPYEQK